MEIPQEEIGGRDRPHRARIERWELLEGTMRLFIVGPGPESWWPVTAPSSSGEKHGTPKERAIAYKAVRELSRRFSDTSYATAKDIRKILERHGWKPDHLTIYPA